MMSSDHVSENSELQEAQTFTCLCLRTESHDVKSSSVSEVYHRSPELSEGPRSLCAFTSCSANRKKAAPDVSAVTTGRSLLCEQQQRRSESDALLDPHSVRV